MENPEKYKECGKRKKTKEYSKKWHAERYKRMTPEERKKRCFNSARANAKRNKKRLKEFSLEFSDLDWPEFCPVLGVKLNYGCPSGDKSKKDNSPSIDRMDCSKGYIPGNVAVMSWRANMLKCDGTLEEFEKLVLYLKRLGD